MSDETKWVEVAEVAEFEASRFFQDAVRLRKWDDLAKIVGLKTPDLDHYWGILESVARTK